MMERILVIEDDPTFRGFLQKVLVKEGYEVSGAESGEKGLLLLRREGFDLVISDLKMPVMDGMELALWMSEARPHVPAIMMSAAADPQAVASLVQKGYSYFEKPLDQKKLFDVVHSLLSDQSGRRTH